MPGLKHPLPPSPLLDTVSTPPGCRMTVSSQGTETDRVGLRLRECYHLRWGGWEQGIQLSPFFGIPCYAGIGTHYTIPRWKDSFLLAWRCCCRRPRNWIFFTSSGPEFDWYTAAKQKKNFVFWTYPFLKEANGSTPAPSSFESVGHRIISFFSIQNFNSLPNMRATFALALYLHRRTTKPPPPPQFQFWQETSGLSYSPQDC